MLRHFWENFLCPCALCKILVIPGPVASRGSLLFFLMMELSKMHTFYKQPGTCFTEANCFFHNMPGVWLYMMIIIFVFVRFRVFQLTNVLRTLNCCAASVDSHGMGRYRYWKILQNLVQKCVKGAQGINHQLPFNCLKVTSDMIFTRSWQLRTECHSGPFRQLYFCLLGMFWPWQSESSSIKAYYPACHLPGTRWMPLCKWSPAPWARSHFARFGLWRGKRAHTHLGWDVLKQVTRTHIPQKSMNDNATMNDNEKRMDGREDLFPNCPDSASWFAGAFLHVVCIQHHPRGCLMLSCTKLCHTYCLSLCFFQLTIMLNRQINAVVPSSLQFVRHVNKVHLYQHMSYSLTIIKWSQYRSSLTYIFFSMFPTNHLLLSDASCLHAAMPSHASSQVVRRQSQSAALTMTSALQAVEEREHRNSDAIEPQGQFRVERICKRLYIKGILKNIIEKYVKTFG